MKKKPITKINGKISPGAELNLVRIPNEELLKNRNKAYKYLVP